MSDYLATSHETAEPPAAVPEPPKPPVVVRRRRRNAHGDTLRFHLLLNLALAIAATWVLKIDGPYYADGIAAGIFVVGFIISIWSFRSVRHSEKASDHTGVSTAPVFAALALFFLAAAVAVIWFTYLSPPEPVNSDEGATAALAIPYAAV